jgi:MFS family permease
MDLAIAINTTGLQPELFDLSRQSQICLVALRIGLLKLGVKATGMNIQHPAEQTNRPATGVVTDTRERASAIAMWAAAGSLALVAGPVAGGVLIKYFGWKSIFLINFPLGLFSIIMIQRLAPASQRSRTEINLPGQASIIMGLAMMTFALTEAGEYGWKSPVTLAALILGIMLLAVFRRIDNRSANPIIARELIKKPLVNNAILVGYLCNLVFYGGVFIFSIFFQNRLHLSALETGIAFIPMMALTATVIFVLNGSRTGTPYGHYRSLVVTQLNSLHSRLSGQKFEVLFINAGIVNKNQGETVGEVSAEEFINLMITNALSTHSRYH